MMMDLAPMLLEELLKITMRPRPPFGVCHCTLALLCTCLPHLACAQATFGFALRCLCWSTART